MDDPIRSFSGEGVLAARPVDDGSGDVRIGLLQDIESSQNTENLPLLILLNLNSS